MATNQEAKDIVRDEIEQQLAQTPFTCSSLSRLSGGTANFVYRGKPASGDPSSLIIKHTKNYLSSNASFQLDATRCVSLFLSNCGNLIHDLIEQTALRRGHSRGSSWSWSVQRGGYYC